MFSLHDQDIPMCPELRGFAWIVTDKPEQFILLFLPLKNQSPVFCLWWLLVCFLSLQISFSYSRISYEWNHMFLLYLAFGGAGFKIMFLVFIHVVPFITYSTLCSIVLCYVYHTLSILPWVDVWLVFGFCFLWAKLHECLQVFLQTHIYVYISLQ